MSEAQQVLDFWFGRAGEAHYGRERAVWFRKDTAFDAAIRARFEPLWEAARRGELGSWRDAPADALALVVLTDQFPRNMFRGMAQAFATDPLAREVAREALERGVARAVTPVQRVFFYLPFEHSENLSDQDLAVQLFSALDSETGDTDYAPWARRHREVIARFGRFPHRNAALGRASTPEEQEFLRQPGSGF